MIQISYWAKNHKAMARVLLAILHTVLYIATVYVAILLDQVNVHLHYTVPLAAFVLTVASVCVYKSSRQAKKSFLVDYYKRKSCEFIFLWTTIICICFVYNKDSRVAYFNSYQTLNGSFSISEKKVKEKPATSDNTSKKSVRKQVKELIRELKKNRASSGGKTALIALVVLGGIGLTLLLAGLSCNLSCNGNEALANVVLVGGLAAIIFLMVLAIKKINRSRRVGEEAQIPYLPAL